MKKNPQSVYAEFLTSLGVKESPSLDMKNTPRRVAKMFVEELLSSYKDGALGKLKSAMTTFPADGAYDMVVEGPVSFASLCAHHTLPFTGWAYVGYIPGERIVGLSKIPRVVEFFSRKFQVQERMTKEITDFLDETLQPKGVMVVLKASHSCMEIRGIQARGSMTLTSALRGAFEAAEVRAEFLSHIDRLSK